MRIKLKVRNVRRLITIALLLVLVVFFGSTTTSFYTLRNIQQLFREAAFVGLVACGLSFVMIGGGIDLSSGGIICVSGILTAQLSTTGAPGIICVLGGVLIGCICGFINGFCVTKLHINDFITTLAAGYVYNGLALVFMFRDAKGRVASPALTNAHFLAWGQKINGWYYISIAWIVLSIICFIIHRYARYGQHLLATGSDVKSAEMSGINTRAIKLSSFIFAGAFCGLAAVFTVAYQATAYLSLGGTIGFQAVACCVMGGIILGGARGDALCAVLGTLFMTIILNGLYKFGFSTAWQYICQGIIILVIILFDALFGRINQKRVDKMAQIDSSEEGEAHL